jgi:urease accessory protein
MFLLYQLADSAFPTGGFAHSGGLEASVQAGVVDDIAAWLRDATIGVAHGALPFVSAAYRDVAVADRDCEAFLTSSVANRASRTQGRALVDTCARIFPGFTRPVVAHHAPAFGACAQQLGVNEEDARRVFLHLSLRSLASAAVRLGVIGPHRAQAIHFELHGLLASLERVEQPAVTAPLQELFGATHDQLYSRLFQS